MEEKRIIQYNYTGERLLIFGGSYSNFQALEELKRIADKHGFNKEQIICTGDVVAYCAQPEESVNLIKDWGILTIAGNVEIQLRNGDDDCGCNFNEGSRCDLFSRQWYPYAKAHLSEASIDWMHGLPDVVLMDWNGTRVGIVHGTHEVTAGYIFGSTPWEEKKRLIDNLGVDLMIGGHCGLPFHHLEENQLWFNAGVIGMPANDGTDRVWYAIAEMKEEEIVFTHHCFEYDAVESSARMREEKLPQEYAKTLLNGIWDSNEILPPAETALQGQPISLSDIQVCFPKKPVIVQSNKA